MLIQLCKGKSLPSKCKCSEPQKAAVIHLWRGRAEFSVKVENRKHYLYYDDKKDAEKIRNQRHCSEFGAIKIHHSLKDMCFDLSKKAIQSLFNQNKANIQRRFSNNAVLRPIRAEKIQT